MDENKSWGMKLGIIAVLVLGSSLCLMGCRRHDPTAAHLFLQEVLQQLESDGSIDDELCASFLACHDLAFVVKNFQRLGPPVFVDYYMEHYSFSVTFSGVTDVGIDVWEQVENGEREYSLIGVSYRLPKDPVQPSPEE